MGLSCGFENSERLALPNTGGAVGNVWVGKPAAASVRLEATGYHTKAAL